MDSEPLNEREFELINIVGAQLSANQRDLSRHMDLSLGAINMLVHRLIAKGYIRTKQLNRRKVQYILTPKGFAEKMRKSIKYTVKTLNSISLIKEHIKKVVIPFYEKGERNFYILGESDLGFLVEMVFRKIHPDGYKLTHIKELPNYKVDGILLICKEDVDGSHPNANNCVDLIQDLAMSDVLIKQNSV